MRNGKHNSRGFTLITTLMLLFLLSGLAIGMLMMVNTEVKVGTQDVQNNMTFHAAEGGIENMTAQLATVLQNNLSPSISDIENLGTAPGAPTIPGVTFPTYTLTPVLNAAGTAPALTTGTVPSGNYAGLTATLMDINLNATAQGPLGDEVNMTRTVEVAFIPVFQFGVFSDLDLAFFSSPDIDFNGRVHTNGDLCLGCGGGNTCTFHQQLSAYGNVIRAVLPNGLAASAYNDTGTVDIPTAVNGCNGSNCVSLPTSGNLWGSLTGAGGDPPASAYNNGNPSWKTISLTDLAGMMIDGDFGLDKQTPPIPTGAVDTGATALTLPFIAGTSAAFSGPGLNIGAQAFEIIRRAPAGEVATTPLGASRLYNEASIRVMLSDRPDELPGGVADPDNVRLASLASNQGNGNNYSRGVPTKFPAVLGLPALAAGQVYTTYFATASTAIPNPSTSSTSVAVCGAGITLCYYADWLFAPGAPTVANEFVNDGTVPRIQATNNYGVNQAPPAISVQNTYPYYVAPTPNSGAGDTQWNLIDGYLRVEFLPQTNSCPGPGAQVNGYCAITREWLQLGFARGPSPPTAAYANPLPAGSNPVNPYAILLFQQPAMRVTSGATVWPNAPPLDSTGTVPAGCTGGLKCTSGKPPEVPYDLVLNNQNAAWKYPYYSDCTGSVTTGSYCTAGAESNTAFNWYPINIYDGREGEPSDTVQGNNTCTPAGVMNLVELDVGNLNQWLQGNIPGSGSLVNNTNENGYVLYFSDRRGMLPNPNGTQTITGSSNPLTSISGDSGFEDVVNSSSNTRVPDGILENIPANKQVSPEDNNLNGFLDNFGAKNLGLGLGYVPTPSNAPATAYNAATSVNSLVNTAPPDPYVVGNRMACAVLNTSVPQRAWISGARHGLKLVDGSLGNVPTIPGGSFPNSTGGFTIGSENPVYIQGNYNSNCGASGQTGCTSGNANYDTSWPAPVGTSAADSTHSAAGIIADTVVLLSNAWLDWNSFFGNGGANSPPTNPQNGNRTATDTYYRTAIASGRVQDFAFPTGWANGTTYYTGTDGGVHNFLQFREDWGQGTYNLYYKGSMVNLFYSTYNTGIMKCCAYSVYTPPSRHYLFDGDFSSPSELPPGTPTFRDIDNLSYRQNFTPCTVGTSGVCSN